MEHKQIKQQLWLSFRNNLERQIKDSIDNKVNKEILEGTWRATYNLVYNRIETQLTYFLAKTKNYITHDKA